jgi:tetratricopeptide (TPR) repeat protein
MAKEDISRNSLSSAERTLEQAILLNNRVPEAFHLLGYVYAKKGRFKKAILAFQKALQLDPFHTEAAIALSSLYNDVGRYKEGAQVFYKTKKRLDPQPPGFDPRINKSLALKHFEMGLLYSRFERYREAYHEFSKVVQLEPENATAAVQMAKCLSKVGDKAGAMSLLRKTLQQYPQNIDARLQLGILHHSQKNLREAQKEWQEALSIDPENKTVQMYLSMIDFEPGVAPRSA